MGVSYTFADGATLTALQLNQNNSDLVALLSQIRSGSLAPDAGITARQIADRYVAWEEHVPLIPYSQVATISSVLTYPSKRNVSARPGQELYLCLFEAYVVVVGGTLDAALTVAKNGVTLGGGSVTLGTSANYYKIGNIDPIANPIIGAQDGDEFTITLQSASGAATIQGLSARLVWKRELSS